MSLIGKLQQRQRDGQPIRIGLIGAGKFGSMFLAQARTTPGLHVVAIADLDPERVRENLARIGWPEPAFSAPSIGQALAGDRSCVTADTDALFAAEAIDVIVECTGHVISAVDHVLKAFAAGQHVVMVTVEADAVVGPALAARAADAGVVYTLAYGDQPALICELVDWARTAGFRVVCAGKGTKYLPAYHASTPDTVWSHYGFTEQQVASGDYNAQMFNSFLDGTKSALEMAAVANATGLVPQSDGLRFPPSPADELAQVCRPQADGGVLERPGTVEVVSSLHRDGRAVARDLRWGVYVTFITDNEYVQRCFQEYGVVTDDSGRYAALYRPTHYIGLELGLSVAQACLRGEPTGVADQFVADVVSVAKDGLAAGERLDGEGGYTVYGKLLPAALSVPRRLLPLGLSAGLQLRRPVAGGEPVSWADVEAPPPSSALALRREMERTPGPSPL